MKLHKRLATVLATSIILTSTPIITMASDYETHWAKETIDKWKKHGYVQGFEDGLFRPNDAITKAQFAKVMVELFKYNDTEGSKTYIDVENDKWYSSSIEKISASGIMYETGDTFNPNVGITREEAAYAIVNAYKLVDKKSDKVAFIDEDLISNWAIDNVKILHNLGYIEGRPDGSFSPKGILTRAELITILDRINIQLKNTSIDKEIDINKIFNEGFNNNDSESNKESGSTTPDDTTNDGGNNGSTTPDDTTNGGGNNGSTTPDDTTNGGGNNGSTTPDDTTNGGGNNGSTTPDDTTNGGGNNGSTTPDDTTNDGGNNGSTTPDDTTNGGGNNGSTTPDDTANGGGNNGSTTPDDTTNGGGNNGSTTPDDTTNGGGNNGSTTPDDTTNGGGNNGSTTPDDTTNGGGNNGSTTPDDTTNGGGNNGSTTPDDTTNGGGNNGSTTYILKGHATYEVIDETNKRILNDIKPENCSLTLTIDNKIYEAEISNENNQFTFNFEKLLSLSADTEVKAELTVTTANRAHIYYTKAYIPSESLLTDDLELNFNFNESKINSANIKGDVMVGKMQAPAGYFMMHSSDKKEIYTAKGEPTANSTLSVNDIEFTFGDTFKATLISEDVIYTADTTVVFNPNTQIFKFVTASENNLEHDIVLTEVYKVPDNTEEGKETQKVTGTAIYEIATIEGDKKFSIDEKSDLMVTIDGVEYPAAIEGDHFNIDLPENVKIEEGADLKAMLRVKVNGGEIIYTTHNTVKVELDKKDQIKAVDFVFTQGEVTQGTVNSNVKIDGKKEGLTKEFTITALNGKALNVTEIPTGTNPTTSVEDLNCKFNDTFTATLETDKGNIYTGTIKVVYDEYNNTLQFVTIEENTLKEDIILKEVKTETPDDTEEGKETQKVTGTAIYEIATIEGDKKFSIDEKSDLMVTIDGVEYPAAIEGDHFNIDLPENVKIEEGTDLKAMLRVKVNGGEIIYTTHNTVKVELDEKDQIKAVDFVFTQGEVTQGTVKDSIIEIKDKEDVPTKEFTITALNGTEVYRNESNHLTGTSGSTITVTDLNCKFDDTFTATLENNNGTIYTGTIKVVYDEYSNTLQFVTVEKDILLNHIVLTKTEDSTSKIDPTIVSGEIALYINDQLVTIEEGYILELTVDNQNFYTAILNGDQFTVTIDKDKVETGTELIAYLKDLNGNEFRTKYEVKPDKDNKVQLNNVILYFE